MFAIRLKELREKNSLSQKAFSIKIGVSQSTVGMWESNRREPNFETVEKLANFFNVSVDYLLGREEKAAPQEKQQKPNTIKILGRDGSCVERQLTDDQIDLMKRMIEQMPDADDL